MFDFLKPNQHDLYPAPCHYLMLAGGVQDNCLLSNEISRRLFYRILLCMKGKYSAGCWFFRFIKNNLRQV